jgi:chromosome segregation ATPase
MYYQVHQVPVGDHQTQQNIGKILPVISENFSRIYTSTHMYAFTKSRYTGQVSSSSNQISDSFFLNSSIDTTQLRKYEQEEANLLRSLQEMEKEIAGILDQKQKIEKQIEANRNEMNKLREKRNHISTLAKKIKSKEQILETLVNQNIDLVAESRKRLEKIAEFSKKKVKLFVDYTQSAKSLVMLNKDKVLVAYEEAQLQSAKIKIEADLRNYTSRKQELENELERAMQSLKGLK